MSSERKVPDDRELEDFLAGRHPVGRAYREVSENETAPHELDDAILKMAREHAATAPAPVMPRRRPRWLQPLAVAATLALSLGVLMNIWREPSLRKQATPMEQGREEALSEAQPAPEASSRAAPVEMAEPMIEAAKPAPFKRERSELDDASRSQLPEARRAEPFPAQDRESSVGAVAPSSTSPRAASSDAAAAVAPPPPPPAMQAAPASPPAPSGGAAASRPDIDLRALDRDGPADARHSTQKSFGSLDSGDAAPALAKEKAEQKKSTAEDDAAAANAQAESAREELESRESLIERARAAVARGDTDEARRIVAELRRLHPDAPLPEDLRALAPSAP